MIAEIMKSAASRIDATIEQHVSKYPSDLNEPALHLLRAGGKRLRPCILIQSALSVGGDESDAYPLAASLELLHDFTLVHDDIMDEDVVRHGVPSVHARWGVPSAILVGDFLFSKAFEMALETPSHVPPEKVLESIKVLAEAVSNVAIGQSQDMNLARATRVSEAQYLEMVKKKTAALYLAASRIGAVIGGGSPRQVSALSEYGESSGIAFQIQDDLLGLVGTANKIRKPVGSDIREGKKTLPMLYALGNLPEESRRRLLAISGDQKASEQEIQQAIQLVIASGGVTYTKKRQAYYLKRALQALEFLPETPAKTALADMAKFMVERDY